MDRYKEVKQPRYVPPESDFLRVYRVADQEQRAILLICLHLAARKQEVFTLAWEDVDFQGNKIRLWTNKRDGGKEADWLPMTLDLKKALQEQRFKTGFQHYVFVNPKTNNRYTWRSGMMKWLCKKAGVRYFGLHAIRHLSACLMDEGGEPLAYIQMMLRHKSATTTSKYLRSLRGIKPTAVFERKERVESKVESPKKLTSSDS